MKTSIVKECRQWAMDWYTRPTPKKTESTMTTHSRFSDVPIGKGYKDVKRLVSLPGFLRLHADRLGGTDQSIFDLIQRERPGPWQLVEVEGRGNCFYYAANIGYFLATGRVFADRNIDVIREACNEWLLEHANTPVTLSEELHWPSLRAYIEEEAGMNMIIFTALQFDRR